MVLPIKNTTCDIYRASSPQPPNPPDVAGVPCFLEPRGQSTLTTNNYSHVLWVGPTVDIRDAGGTFGLGTGNQGDFVYVPNQAGNVKYVVVGVRRYARGTALDHKKALLQRVAAQFPTDNV